MNMTGWRKNNDFEINKKVIFYKKSFKSNNGEMD